MDKREPDPRKALADAAERSRTSLAALSRMIDRPSPYLARFAQEGRPIALEAKEHQVLADHFGLDERGLASAIYGCRCREY